ncbi:hypothetical protein ACHWQZ_G003686 [Mnemiopsis leidyi]
MFLLTFLSLWRASSSNNVDVESPLIVKGSQPGSLFGYSAMIHPLSSHHVFLVGAPRANTTQQLVSPGAVYKCPGEFGELKTIVSCSEWLDVFDNSTGDAVVDILVRTDEGTEEVEKTIESKSGQFLGVTLTRTNTSVIGCANRYIDHYGLKGYQSDRKLPVGRCSAISLELDQHQGFLVPCKDIADTHDSYGSCQAGTSVAHNGKQLSISAPNANNGLGNSFFYKSGTGTAREDILELLTDSWRGSSVTAERQDVRFLDYAGYSTVFCDVNGDGNKELVLGMPRANYYRGSIRVHIGSMEEQELVLEDELMLKEYLRLVENREIGRHRDADQFENLGILCPSGHPDFNCFEPQGAHMGSYFGHTMTCADLNGDGYDDLVISAPYFSELNEGNGMTLTNDIGQVKVYFGYETDHYSFPYPDFSLSESKVLFGNKRDSGLFGYSLNSEGDLNFDNYKDLVVGAPYEDDGRGAVYIFNGGSEFFETHSQKITPLQFNEPLQGFGSAISSGYNIDERGGDELLVGSFLSDTVVAMRTIPTIDITPTLLLKYKVVNLEVSHFIEPKTGESVVGNTLKINISTIGLEFENNTMQLNWKLILDPINLDPVDKRAYIRLEETSNMLYSLAGSILLEPNKLTTVNTLVNVLLKRDTIRDTKNLHIDIEGSLDGFREPEKFSNKWALKYELFRQARTTILIDTNCNKDTGVCTSDVGISNVTTELVPAGYPHVVINKVEYVNLYITLENKGPDLAYEAVFNIDLPVELDLSSATDLHGVACEEGDTSNTVECRVDGAFDVGTRNIKIELLVNSSLLSHGKVLAIRGNMTVGSPSIDPVVADNVRSVYLQSFHLADLTLQGGPNKASQPFMNSILPDIAGPKTWEDIGPEVKHSLSVSVEELMDVESVTDIHLNIRWPLKMNSQYVLYLTEIYIPPIYRHKIECDQRYVNQLGLKSGSSPDRRENMTSPDTTDPETEEVEGLLFGYAEDAEYDCRTHSCHVIKCRIPELQRGTNNNTYVKLEIRSRLWESTFKNNYRVAATSYSRIESVGGDLVLPLVSARTKAITSKFYLPNERKGLNLAVIILSALAGLAIVAVIAFVLWKKGFFKSNYFNRTPSNMFQTGARLLRD